MLVTHAEVFMGPALCEVFEEHGAEVISATNPLIDPEAPARIVAAAGKVDVLVANLSVAAPRTPATEASDNEWQPIFAAIWLISLWVRFFP